MPINEAEMLTQQTAQPVEPVMTFAEFLQSSPPEVDLLLSETTFAGYSHTLPERGVQRNVNLLEDGPSTLITA